MSAQRQLLWLLVFIAAALLAVRTIAGFVHITITFGTPPPPAPVLRIEAIDPTAPILRALPQKYLFTPARHLEERQIDPTCDRAPSPARGVNPFVARSAFNPRASVSMAAREVQSPGRFLVGGRVFVVGAQSDAGVVAAQSCRPGATLLEIHPMHDWAARSASTVIRDGRERGSKSTSANA